MTKIKNVLRAIRNYVIGGIVGLIFLITYLFGLLMEILIVSMCEHWKDFEDQNETFRISMAKTHLKTAMEDLGNSEKHEEFYYDLYDVYEDWVAE